MSSYYSSLHPYQQIAYDLRRLITSGYLKPGDRLPSSRDLKYRYNVAEMTARNGLRTLCEQGLARSVTGRGTFVSDLPEPDQESRSEASTRYTASTITDQVLDELYEELDHLRLLLAHHRTTLPLQSDSTDPPGWTSSPADRPRPGRAPAP
ncbi:winged helix-turn-helix domain-containing protein [Streptomyces sp. NPDC001889]